MVQITVPKRSDIKAWMPLWQAYLKFYEHDLSPEITKKTWDRFFDPNETCFILCAKLDHEWVGFVTFLYHRSSWSPTQVCYLEDLYVTEKVRGQGVGRALIEAVREKAYDHGCDRIYWMTKQANETAQKLYDKIAERTDFIQYIQNL